MEDMLILLILLVVVGLILFVCMNGGGKEGYRKISQHSYDKCQQEYQDCYESGKFPGYVCAEMSRNCLMNQ